MGGKFEDGGFWGKRGFDMGIVFIFLIVLFWVVIFKFVFIREEYRSVYFVLFVFLVYFKWSYFC